MTYSRQLLGGDQLGEWIEPMALDEKFENFGYPKDCDVVLVGLVLACGHARVKAQVTSS